MGELSYGDKIFKLLHQCNKDSDKPDLHSFIANIKDGTVFVECRGYEVYIDSTLRGGNGEKKSRWVGTTTAASNKLEMLGIDLQSVDI